MPAGSKSRLSNVAVRCGALFVEAVERILFSIVNLPARFGGYRRCVDVCYGSLPQQRLDVYVPAAGAPHAIVVFWHGGRWTFGDKADYRFVGAALAALNCVAVVPNYRHYPTVKMPGFMADAALAVAFVRAHAHEWGADPARIYLMGHSAGAQMAALLALDPRHLAAQTANASELAGVIGLSGAYDFLPLTDADLQDMFGPPEDYPDSQPIHFAHAAAPPFLLIHGLKDELVRPKNARNLAAALERVGVQVHLRLHNVGHGATVAALSKLLQDRLRVRGDIATFLQPPTNAARSAQGFARAAYKR